MLLARAGVDPTTVAVMLEDGGAVAGLLIAGGCTALTHATGNAMWDAVGSIMVGPGWRCRGVGKDERG